VIETSTNPASQDRLRSIPRRNGAAADAETDMKSKMGGLRIREVDTVTERGSAGDLEVQQGILHGEDETTIAIRSTEAQEIDPHDIEIAEEMPGRRRKILQHKSAGRARALCPHKKHHSNPTKTLRMHLSREVTCQKSKSQILLHLGFLQQRQTQSRKPMVQRSP